MADERLIPAGYRDERARTVNLLAARLGELPLANLLVSHPDLAPVGVLPHLAEQYNVLGTAWWQLATTEAAQRQVLKDSDKLHRKKGTPGAIKRAILALGFAEVDLLAREPEWWQYRLFVRGRPITPEDAALIKEIAADFAPARAELAQLSYGRKELWESDGQWGNDGTPWGGYMPYELV